MKWVHINGRDVLLSQKEINDIKPWDRQLDETPMAYEAFCVYRDLGPQRTVQKAALRAGKRERAFERWRTKYSWIERAKAYDYEMIKIEFEAERREKWKRAKKHAESAELMQKKARKYMKKHTLRSNREALDYLETGIKIEREAYGDRESESGEPTVQVNILGKIASQVATEVEQFREQLIAEARAELAARRAIAGPSTNGDVVLNSTTGGTSPGGATGGNSNGRTGDNPEQNQGI